MLPPDIPQYFVPATSTGTSDYKPALVGAAKLHYLDDKQKLDETRDVVMLVPIEQWRGGGRLEPGESAGYRSG